MKMHKDRLTERQRLFCEHYVGAGKHNAAVSARMAGYAPGCSHVTGCQLLQQPKIAAIVRGLEEVLAQEIGVTRQAVIAQLVGAADLARELREPSSMISAFRNVAQICGYYRQEKMNPATRGADDADLVLLHSLSDEALLEMMRTERAVVA